jgi:predicted nucleotidyltransferase
MNFPKVLAVLRAELSKAGIDFALLGGLAIHAWGTSRTTSDVDLLAFLASADQIDGIMKRLGYDVLFRNENVGNYLSKDWEMGRVDVLFAHRKYTTAMLARAKTIDLLGGSIKIVIPEDLIGLKVQASSNNPQRMHRDMNDVEDLMKKHGHEMDWSLIREYFQLFERIPEFDELKKRYT